MKKILLISLISVISTLNIGAESKETERIKGNIRKAITDTFQNFKKTIESDPTNKERQKIIAAWNNLMKEIENIVKASGSKDMPPILPKIRYVSNQLLSLEISCNVLSPWATHSFDEQQKFKERYKNSLICVQKVLQDELDPKLIDVRAELENITTYRSVTGEAKSVMIELVDNLQKVIASWIDTKVYRPTTPIIRFDAKGNQQVNPYRTSGTTVIIGIK